VRAVAIVAAAEASYELLPAALRLAMAASLSVQNTEPPGKLRSSTLGRELSGNLLTKFDNCG